MRILIGSYAFAPSVGGVETVSRLLAEQFVRLGHDVRVVTSTPAEGSEPWPFEVIRRPSPMRLVNSVRWCDAYLQNGLSLRMGWPLAMIGRPIVVSHFSWYARDSREGNWRARIKLAALRRCRIAAVSRDVLDDLPADMQRRGTVIHNPYDDARFTITNHGERRYDIVFLGRLVTDKGVDLLLHALHGLQQRDIRPRLVIVGRGPEEEKLRAMTERLGLNDRVRLLGGVPDAELVRILNDSRVMVIPTVRSEGFGVVALEGMACGCVVVGSDNGGLPEAIGPGGAVFPTGDITALENQLEALLTSPAQLDRYRAAGQAHVARHTAQAVAARYLQLLSQLMDGS